MTPQQALQILRDTDPALAAVLQHIMQEQARLSRNQQQIVERLITHILTPPGASSAIDITELMRILKEN